MQAASGARSECERSVRGQSTKCPRAELQAAEMAVETGMCVEVQRFKRRNNKKKKYMAWAEEEASWGCIRIAVVLLKSPQGQCGVGSESRHAFKS